jgi:diaminopimelate epimerase
MQIAKYNASGNDFVIFHTFKEQDFSGLAMKLCHRQSGIGADGLIVLLPHDTYDFKWKFYNSDGSDAAMCGNGSRACAHYAYSNALADKSMKFLTDAGVIASSVEGNIVESQLTDVEKISESFSENGREWHFYDTGVPHLVTFVKKLDEYSQELAAHMRYSYNANVNFVLYDENALHVRTYERGVEDETLACGTGMAACYYTAYKKGLVGESARVYPASKEELNLRISDGKLFFRGAVQKIFETSLLV